MVGTEDNPWSAIARNRGYSLHYLPPIIDSEALRRGSLALSAAQAQAAIHADLRLLDEFRPDLVLLDWRPSMRLAASMHGIPVVAIVNAHVTRAYRGPLAAPERHPLTRLFGQRLADRLMPIISPLFYRFWARPFQRYPKKQGARSWGDYRDYLVGDRTLYPDLPSLAPATEGSGIYVGPLVRYPLPVQPLPPLRSPVLYISFGSDLAPDDSQAVVEAAKDWPGSIVVTRGGGEATWPSAWISVDYVDPAELIKKTTHMAWLFHGGNGTSYQLLQHWHFDPDRCGGAVIVPLNVEQQWNALKLAGLGIARRICPAHRLAAAPDLAETILELSQVHPPRIPHMLAHEIEIYDNASERTVQEVAPLL